MLKKAAGPLVTPPSERPGHASPAGLDPELAAALDQVFLTPRVVDQRAFEELAGSLRSVTKDAIAQARALAATTGEVKLLGNQLRQATQELDQKVQTAARVIPTLDQRVQRAEQLLGQAPPAVPAQLAAPTASGGIPPDLDRMIHDLVARAVEEHLAQIRAIVQQSADAAAASLARSESAADRAVQSLHQTEQVSVRVEELAAVLEQAVDKATSAQTQVEAAVVDDRSGNVPATDPGAGIAQAEQDLRDLVSCARDASKECEDAVQRLEALRTTVAGELGSFEEALTEGVTQVASLKAQVHELAAAATPLQADSQSQLQQLRQMGDSLSRLLTQGDQIGRGLARLVADARQALQNNNQ